MSRKPRVEFSGATYHVFQRGNNKENIFEDPIEKGYFIKQIKEYMSLYECELFAYIIMDNHYHLIVRTNGAPLNKIMHSINNVYSKFYNYRHERTGHVFEERYNSKLIEDDAYIIWLLRYIHRNPVRAHMCDSVSDYKWSSDFFYRRGQKLFIDIDMILSILSSNRNEAIKKYCLLMNDPEESNDYDYKNIKLNYPDNFLKNKLMEPQDVKKPKRKTMDEIISGLNLDKEHKDLIKSGSRKRHLVNMKLQFIDEALKCKYTHKEIGEFIGISQPAVSKLINGKKVSQ